MSARFGIFIYIFFAFLRRLFGQLCFALLALLGFCHWHNLGHTRKSTTEHGLVLGAGAVSLGKECHRLCHRLCYRLSQWSQDPAGPYQQYTVARLSIAVPLHAWSENIPSQHGIVFAVQNAWMRPCETVVCLASGSSGSLGPNRNVQRTMATMVYERLSLGMKMNEGGNVGLFRWRQCVKYRSQVQTNAAGATACNVGIKVLFHFGARWRRTSQKQICRYL